MTTHKGIFKVKRLNFGNKVAPAEFNWVMDRIIAGLDGVEIYFDDIIVLGESREQCLQNLQKCLHYLCKNDLHLNWNKCVFFATQIEYLGHVIQYNQIKKSLRLMKAVDRFHSEVKTLITIGDWSQK